MSSMSARSPLDLSVLRSLLLVGVFEFDNFSENLPTAQFIRVHPVYQLNCLK